MLQQDRILLDSHYLLQWLNCGYISGELITWDFTKFVFIMKLTIWRGLSFKNQPVMVEHLTAVSFSCYKPTPRLFGL